MPTKPFLITTLADGQYSSKVRNYWFRKYIYITNLQTAAYHFSAIRKAHDFLFHLEGIFLRFHQLSSYLINILYKLYHVNPSQKECLHCQRRHDKSRDWRGDTRVATDYFWPQILRMAIPLLWLLIVICHSYNCRGAF